MPLGICNILYLIGLMPYASRPCMQPAQPAAAACLGRHPSPHDGEALAHAAPRGPTGLRGGALHGLD
jgi:hypothetical protein